MACSSQEISSILNDVWLFDQRDHLNRYIKNHGHLTALSGHAVIRFGKMYGMYVPPKAYHQVGDQVKKGIGSLLVNISRSVEKMEREKRQRLSAMAKEMSFDGDQKAN